MSDFYHCPPWKPEYEEEESSSAREEPENDAGYEKFEEEKEKFRIKLSKLLDDYTEKDKKPSSSKIRDCKKYYTQEEFTDYWKYLLSEKVKSYRMSDYALTVVKDIRKYCDFYVEI